MYGFTTENDGFTRENDGFTTENDGFTSQNDGFTRLFTMKHGVWILNKNMLAFSNECDPWFQQNGRWQMAAPLWDAAAHDNGPQHCRKQSHPIHSG